MVAAAVPVGAAGVDAAAAVMAVVGAAIDAAAVAVGAAGVDAAAAVMAVVAAAAAAAAVVAAAALNDSFRKKCKLFFINSWTSQRQTNPAKCHRL